MVSTGNQPCRKSLTDRPGESGLVHPRNVPSSSFATQAYEDGDEAVVITSIRVTDIVTALRRLPVGFYVAVQHSGREWRTENKPVSVDDPIVEWGGPIPIPSDLTATVCLRIRASFEFQPMLGIGEQLRELTVTVKQLLDHSAIDHPFTICPEVDNGIPSCSSILVPVKRVQRRSSDPLAPEVLECTITESRDQIEDVTDRGHSALSRYRKCGSKRDLEHAIEQFEHALDVCPLVHPWRAVVQSNLAMAKFICYQVNNAHPSLDISLSLYRNALIARPVGHPDRPFTLIRLAIVHFARFEKLRETIDATCADELLHEAMSLTSARSHEKRSTIFLLQMCSGRTVEVNNQSLVMQKLPVQEEDPWTLGSRFLLRFGQLGHLADLHQAISVLEAFVRSRPVSDDRYLAGLANLGGAFMCRFMRIGESKDVEEAILIYKKVVDFVPDTSPNKPRLLISLAASLHARFRLFGRPSDLEDAISTYRNVVDFTSSSHPDKPHRLNSLGDTLRACFEKFDDLRQAISSYEAIIDLTPDGHPEISCRLNSFGNLFRARFERSRDLRDLEQAISRQKDAVDITPDSHPHKLGHLFDLRNSLRARFDRIGDLRDLEQMISVAKEAINVISDGHPHKPGYLNDLGSLFLTRFERLNRLNDLEQAISCYRDAVNHTPDGDPSKHGLLANLSLSFKIRFNRLGELNDLEETILGYRNTIDATPDGHPERPCRLNCLGNYFRVRFERLGDFDDLENAISWQKDAVDVTSDCHPHRLGHMRDLRNSLRARFDRLGDPSDLEQVISADKVLVRETPDGHPEKPSFLNTLANSFHARFESLGELGDLEQAIPRYRDAVKLTCDDHPDKPGYLSNLGISFSTLFDRVGELSNLDQAISWQRSAVDLAADGHPDKPDRLTNLGNSLHARFKHLRRLDDLEEAISRQKHAVKFSAKGHPRKPRYLNNLAISLTSRFTHLGELSDLEEAVSRFSDAVASAPDEHSASPQHLCNLGNSLRLRFERLGELVDLEQAILKQRIAVELTSERHTLKPPCLECLAESFIVRFKHRGETSDLEQAISLYSQAATSTIGSVTIRFRASRKWIACAHTLEHHTLLHAYSIAIDLLPQLAWIGLSLSRRYEELVQAADVVREAAAAALESGHTQTAVEWLEQGRSIVWGELFQLRTAYEELSSVHPGHARRLQTLSSALEHASASREISLYLPEEHGEAQSLEENANRHRALAIERDKLLQEIRGFPGFERFLLHKEYSQLRASAISGPVVILNAARSRCDALIVISDKENVIHVPLPNFTLKQSGGLQNILDGLLGPFRDVTCDDRSGKPASRKELTWESLLSSLWKGIVKPVLDVLGFSTPGELSRIYWCPTGPLTFLPIHAAGLYGARYAEPGHKVFDFVISSYVPTLSILTPPPVCTTTGRGDFRVLAVPQPHSDGQSRLPGVQTEMEYIKATVENSLVHTLLQSSIGTVEEVLTLMKEADWVHFACHGVQDSENPSNSGLCLADGRRLKLSDMISLSRPHRGLAFLSACQTAMGDKKLSDEAVHIAAGMLFAGYGGVVGTMWSISDRVAPRVAKDVYEELFRDDATLDYREAARALHNAIARLRNGDVSFVDWVPFIHVGL